VWASRQGLDLGVLPFAVGQLCYGVVLLLVYLVAGYRLAASSGFSLFPRAVHKSNTPQSLQIPRSPFEANRVFFSFFPS
jgi:hypothetical protein